jgi:hypothetical protein
MDIPAGTAIPDWAYMDVTVSDRYNAVAAEADNKPESSAGGNPTVSNPGPASPTSTTQTPKHPTATAAVAVKKSNAGAIAGGVVAGVVFLGISAGLGVFFFLRHKKSHVAPSAAYVTPKTPPTSDYSPQSSTPFNNFSEFSGMQQRPYVRNFPICSVTYLTRYYGLRIPPIQPHSRLRPQLQPSIRQVQHQALDIMRLLPAEHIVACQNCDSSFILPSKMILTLQDYYHLHIIVKYIECYPYIYH